MADSFQAVLFDWRGTLVTTSTLDEWVREALRGSAARPRTARSASSRPCWTARTTCSTVRASTDDADLHRHTYRTAFRDLGVDDDLAEALYAVESDAGQTRSPTTRPRPCSACAPLVCGWPW